MRNVNYANIALKTDKFFGFYLTDEECKCWMVSKLQLKGRGFYLTDEECKCKYGVPVEVVVPVFI